MAENGFLEYVAHIRGSSTKKLGAFRAAFSGAHGAKETSGIASRTARIDAKWQYAPHACCEGGFGATRAHPFGIRSLADLTMAQAPLNAIMTRDVAETLASPAASGGVRELRATQQALGMR